MEIAIVVFTRDLRLHDNPARQLRPNVVQQALDNKKFQTRAITYVAGQGVRQFLDVGSGASAAALDTAPSAYVDDPEYVSIC
jgi:S-adenosyl methyltransferase